MAERAAVAESAKNPFNPNDSRTQPRLELVARWPLRGKSKTLLEICLSGFFRVFFYTTNCPRPGESSSRLLMGAAKW